MSGCVFEYPHEFGIRCGVTKDAHTYVTSHAYTDRLATRPVPPGMYATPERRRRAQVLLHAMTEFTKCEPRLLPEERTNLTNLHATLTEYTETGV